MATRRMTDWQRNLCAIYDLPPWIIAADTGHCTWRDRLWWHTRKIKSALKIQRKPRRSMSERWAARMFK